MIKLAEKMFMWAIKRTAVMMCEAATKRDERLGVDQTQQLQPVRITRDQRRR